LRLAGVEIPVFTEGEGFPGGVNSWLRRFLPERGWDGVWILNPRHLAGAGRFGRADRFRGQAADYVTRACIDKIGLMDGSYWLCWEDFTSD
jgi:hypothetical protein